MEPRINRRASSRRYGQPGAVNSRNGYRPEWQSRAKIVGLVDSEAAAGQLSPAVLVLERYSTRPMIILFPARLTGGYALPFSLKPKRRRAPRFGSDLECPLADLMCSGFLLMVA